jgi:hypothetical protein
MKQTERIKPRDIQYTLVRHITPLAENLKEQIMFSPERIRTIECCKTMACSNLGKLAYGTGNCDTFDSKNSLILYESKTPTISTNLLPADLRILFQEIGFSPNLVLRAHNRLPGDYSTDWNFHENPSPNRGFFMYSLGEQLKNAHPEIEGIAFYCSHNDCKNCIKHKMHQIAKAKKIQIVR